MKEVITLKYTAKVTETDPIVYALELEVNHQPELSKSDVLAILQQTVGKMQQEIAEASQNKNHPNL